MRISEAVSQSPVQHMHPDGLREFLSNFFTKCRRQFPNLSTRGMIEAARRCRSVIVRLYTGQAGPRHLVPF